MHLAMPKSITLMYGLFVSYILISLQGLLVVYVSILQFHDFGSQTNPVHLSTVAVTVSRQKKKNHKFV
jgi:hypothetical protein